jgi:ribosomal protein L6P/L9E
MLATKMKLKGKTLRWRRLYSHSYLLKLGVSHPTRAAIRYGVFGRIISKQKLALWGFSQILISQTAKNLSKLKPLNIYHGRGVRTTRAVIFRKAGKVSSYR